MPLLFLSAVLLTAAPDNPDLKRGEELFAQYKYPEAIKALAKARAVKGLDRESLLKILELTGVCNGQLRQTAPAQAAFREMLILDPTRQLAAEYAPRVMTPFYEVRQEVLDQGGLELKGSAALSASSVEAVVITIVRDPLGMAKAVRFHLDEKSSDVPVTGGTAKLTVAAPSVRWWAELLGDNEAVLASVGSAATPRVDAPAVPVAPAATAPAAVSRVDAAPQQTGGGVRVASYGVMVLGVGAVGVGGYFGAQSSDAFGQVQRGLTTTNGAGVVTSITERRAHELNAQAAQQATIANALFVAGGVLAATGAVLWWFGGPLTVAPAPGGVAIAGALP